MEYIQIGMIVAGLAIRFWAIYTNRIGFNLLVVAPSVLCTRGPYKYIRHPAYLGSLILCAGLFSLCAGSWGIAFGPWFVLWVLLTHTARHEELLLVVSFPEYFEYMQRTGMLLPKLRAIWKTHGET